MKIFILITNLIATAIFIRYLIFAGTDDPMVGIISFFIFIIPFMLILAVINIPLYIIYRVTRRSK